MMNKKVPLAMQDIATNKLNLLCLAKVWLGACLLGVASLAAADLPPVDQVRLETGAKAKVIDTGGRTWVVMVHGWSGVLDEVGDLYARQASQLADRGISSIRMQIQGEGDALQQGKPMDSTFASRVADSLAGYRWVRQHQPEAVIGLLGFSYGGPTVMRLTTLPDVDAVSMVLWSSAVNPMDILRGDARASGIKAALENGVGTWNAWMPIEVTRRHVLGMLGEPILSEFGGYTGALLTLRGSEDYLPQADQAILDASAASMGTSIVIQGADHIFNVVAPDQTLADQQYAIRVLDATTDWFAGTLSLAD